MTGTEFDTGHADRPTTAGWAVAGTTAIATYHL